MERGEHRRIAANEAAFREINEGIARGQWPGEESSPVAFRCECAQLGCNRLIELSVADYERVRAYPRRFVVVAGHELPEAVTVVERREHYVLVEKRGQAGALAEASDPRR
ncbi:MAG: hypothetical protein JO168_00120 [Solirubrobacterales bacterium]|nr:hypothetical protein [Solirubrobacterales bacterium]